MTTSWSIYVCCVKKCAILRLYNCRIVSCLHIYMYMYPKAFKCSWQSYVVFALLQARMHQTYVSNIQRVAVVNLVTCYKHLHHQPWLNSNLLRTIKPGWLAFESFDAVMMWFIFNANIWQISWSTPLISTSLSFGCWNQLVHLIHLDQL